MNRETNLIESIKSWINVPNISEIIVVDWSSTSPLKSDKNIDDWIKNNKIKLIRVNNESKFSLSKSYNLATQYVSNKIILKLDCDYVNIDSSWIQTLNLTKDKELNNYFITGYWKFSGPLNGFILVNKKNFLYYNENFSGWGWDDMDLYKRIKSKNIEQIYFFNICNFVHHIPHSEAERTINYDIKNKLESHEKNKRLSNTSFNLSKYKKLLTTNNYTELERILIKENTND